MGKDHGKWFGESNVQSGEVNRRKGKQALSLVKGGYEGRSENTLQVRWGKIALESDSSWPKRAANSSCQWSVSVL